MDTKAKTNICSNDSSATLNINGDRLSHAYIAGGELADTLAMAAICSASGSKPCGTCAHCVKALRRIHPDITYVDKPQDKQEIVVGQIRELKKDVIIVPNESGKRAYVVNSADLMNRNAQNAFLQILEEPPAHAVFILRTDNASALLQTVRSRCVELKPRTKEDVPDSAAEAMASEFFSVIGKGNAALASFMFRLEKLDKDAFAGFLPAARAQAAALLRADAACDSGIPREMIARAERLLQKAGEMLDLNVSTGHISGMICASLIELKMEN